MLISIFCVRLQQPFGMKHGYEEARIVDRTTNETLPELLRGYGARRAGTLSCGLNLIEGDNLFRIPTATLIADKHNEQIAVLGVSEYSVTNFACCIFASLGGLGMLQ